MQVFLAQSERYLAKQFHCEAAQILLIDKANDQFLSFDPSHPCQLISRGLIQEKSISSHLLNAENNNMYSFPPIKMVNLSRLDQSVSCMSLNLTSITNGGNQQVYHLQFLFNQMTDAPQAFLKKLYQ